MPASPVPLRILRGDDADDESPEPDWPVHILDIDALPPLLMDHPFLKSKEYRDESQIVDNHLIYFLPGKRSKAEAAVLGLASKSDLKKYTPGMAPPEFVPPPSSRLSNVDVKRWRESQANAFRLAAYLHEHPSVTMHDVTSRLVTFTLDGSIEDNRPNAPPKPVKANASVPLAEPTIIVTAIHPSAVDAATLIPNAATPKRTAAELDDVAGSASNKRVKIDPLEQVASPRLKKDGTPYRSRSRKAEPTPKPAGTKSTPRGKAAREVAPASVDVPMEDVIVETKPTVVTPPAVAPAAPPVKKSKKALKAPKAPKEKSKSAPAAAAPPVASSKKAIVDEPQTESQSAPAGGSFLERLGIKTSGWMSGSWLKGLFAGRK